MTEPLGAEEAARLGLPKVIWQQGMYRLVLWWDDEEGTIKRTPERLLGHDLLAGERWGTLGERTWDEDRDEYVVSAEWNYLALVLAAQVPLPAPAEDNAAEEAGALDQAAEDRAQPAAELAHAVQEDEGRPFLACRKCGDMLASAIDAHALIERAHKDGWRTYIGWDGRHPQGAYAVCPDCVEAEIRR